MTAADVLLFVGTVVLGIAAPLLYAAAVIVSLDY